MTTEQRLEKLERENRWMRRIGAVGLAIVAAIAVWPRSRDPKVNSLQVTDKNGTERMWFVTDVDGTPGLSVLDKNGEARMVFGTDADGPVRLSLLDKDGTERMWLVTDADGTPGLVLHDPKGDVIWQAPR